MNNDRIHLIVNHFGRPKQIEKLKEECREFLKDPNNSEIADIYNVVVGIHSTDEEVQQIAEEKQKRTLLRIRTVPGYF
ncbi:MAG: hypothetical protein PF693_14375 [Spirochaetia bacterium]|jgi:predicted house-cleaning noncanonical NTP pyrophosphatase (MazG superfamily)|nr:hypothetical protein [Spirochaetia bacterium]